MHTLLFTVYNSLYIIQLLYIIAYSLDITNIHRIGKSGVLVGLTLSFPVTGWASANTDLPSNSDISKTVKENIVFIEMFFKEYLIGFLMISRLIDFATVVL